MTRLGHSLTSSGIRRKRKKKQPLNHHYSCLVYRIYTRRLQDYIGTINDKDDEGYLDGVAVEVELGPALGLCYGERPGMLNSRAMWMVLPQTLGHKLTRAHAREWTHESINSINIISSPSLPHKCVRICQHDASAVVQRKHNKLVMGGHIIIICPEEERF